MSHYPQACIDLEAVRHNLQQVRQWAPQSQVMSVIKADAYGHGVLPVATALADSDAFAVARLAEGIALRQDGIKKPITVLEGFSDLAELQCMAQYQLTPVIHQSRHIDLLLNTPLAQSLPFCWLMLETGMHRLGLPATAVSENVAKLLAQPQRIAALGLMSHFANSDLLNDVRNAKQLAEMRQLAEQTDLPVCMANSAAVISLPDAHKQWVRPGLMLYGVSPFADKTGAQLGLKPVMQLRSKLIAINDLKPGDEVGYGGQWIASKAGRMGVVSIGYGDGFNRHLSNQGAVFIRGQTLPVIGRVSMDTICIDLQDCSTAEIGDEVILWGNAALTVEWQANQAGTIAYELLCGLTPRVTRKYHHGKS